MKIKENSVIKEKNGKITLKINEIEYSFVPSTDSPEFYCDVYINTGDKRINTFGYISNTDDNSFKLTLMLAGRAFTSYCLFSEFEIY
jgi:hypothetical protein